MSLTDLIYLSQKSLRSNILRSVLTSLGIIIGVSSVITMISIGTGARLEVEQQIERFGSNNLILRAQSSNSRGVSMGNNSVNSLTLKDMEALKSEIPAISAIAPNVSLSSQVIANGNNWLTSVTGTTNEQFNLSNWKFELGREFQEDELVSGSRVAIIGKTVQKNLFGGNSYGKINEKLAQLGDYVMNLNDDISKYPYEIRNWTKLQAKKYKLLNKS